MTSTGPWTVANVRPGCWDLRRNGVEVGMVSMLPEVPLSAVLPAALCDLLNALNVEVAASNASPEDRPFVAAGWSGRAEYQTEIEACQVVLADHPEAAAEASRLWAQRRSAGVYGDVLTRQQMLGWQAELNEMLSVDWPVDSASQVAS